MKLNYEELNIYKQTLELIYYTEEILIKYPKVEKPALVSTIKTTTYDCMKLIIEISKGYNKQKKLNLLNELDSKLKFLKVLIRVSYKRRYINSNNYSAWSKKLLNIGNLLGGWINSVVKIKEVIKS